MRRPIGITASPLISCDWIGARLSARPDEPMSRTPTAPVTVAGAVVNSNAFLWKEGRTAGEYLKLAGADDVAEELESLSAIFGADELEVDAAAGERCNADRTADSGCRGGEKEESFPTCK